MKIKFADLNTPASIIICNAGIETVTKITNAKSEGGGLDIVLTVNGVEIDLNQFAAEVNRQFDEQVKESAEKLAMEKTPDVQVTKMRLKWMRREAAALVDFLDNIINEEG